MNNSYHLFVIYYAGHYAKYFLYTSTHLILMTTHEQVLLFFLLYKWEEAIKSLSRIIE